MPPIQKLQRSHSTKSIQILASSKIKKQLSVSPSKFRFHKYRNIPLGVINPEPTTAEQMREKMNLQNTLGPPKYGSYRPGDRDFMEISGKACKITNVVPNVVYTEADKPQLPDHLSNPFLYVQKIFPKGRPYDEQQLSHPDIFIYFEILRESFRKNNNIRKQDYVQILKQMSQQERKDFYRKCIQINEEYFDFFKKFIKGMRNLKNLKFQLSHKKPKLPIDYITQIAKPMLEKTKEKYNQMLISRQDFVKLMEQCGYPEQDLNRDVQRLFGNVNVGDSPVSFLIKRGQEGLFISLKAFLHNVKKYLKEKYKLKNIFSKNAAKQRNVQIKASVAPFMKEHWRFFKNLMKIMKEQENFFIEHLISMNENKTADKYKNLIKERDQLISRKRVYAKHLQTEVLKYLLVNIQDLKQTYVNDIIKENQRLKYFNEFIEGFYSELNKNEFTLEEVVEYLFYTQYPNYESITFTLQKIMKQKGLPIMKQSRYATNSMLSAQQSISRQDIRDYVQSSTIKKEQEMHDFYEFLSKLRDYVQTLDVKMNMANKQAWEWNLVSEWLLRKLKKIDKKILFLLQKSLECLTNRDTKYLDYSYNDFEQKLSYSNFLTQKTQQQLELTYEQKGIKIEYQWDSDIEFALKQYQESAKELQVTATKGYIEPVQVEKMSASNLIDDKEPVVKIQETQVKPILKIKQEPKIPITQEVPKIPQDIYIAPDFKLYDNKSISTTMTDEDLDRKIRNAILLKGKCENLVSHLNLSFY